MKMGNFPEAREEIQRAIDLTQVEPAEVILLVAGESPAQPYFTPWLSTSGGSSEATDRILI